MVQLYLGSYGSPSGGGCLMSEVPLNAGHTVDFLKACCRFALRFRPGRSLVPEPFALLLSSLELIDTQVYAP